MLAAILRRLSSDDRRAAAATAALLALLLAATWRKWGVPQLDPGLDLSVAAEMTQGKLPYEDLRYYYGPLGLSALALAFELAGPSFTVAFAFGVLQTAAILAAFLALARRWLAPLPAFLATAMLAAIGFSGTLFNFVLPHTNAATFGLLFLLLALLAIARGRTVAAGLAIGAVALTRPEFALFAAAGAAGALAGRARETGLRAAAADAARLALPALAVAGPVLAACAALAGPRRFFFENIVPVDFARISGSVQRGWAPYDLESLAATVGRGLVAGAALAALAAAVVLWRRHRRLLALAAPAAAGAGLLALDGLLRLTGVADGARRAVEDDCVRLLIAMSWLPVAAAAGVAWGALRLRRGGAPPLGGTWPGDLALLLVSGACALRAYDDFTTDVYATYYAAAPLLVAAIGLTALAARRPEAALAVPLALGLAAVSLAVHAQVGLYADNHTEIRTPRGAYVGNDVAAPAIQATVDLVARATRPGEPLLVVPQDQGLYFMTARPSALYDLTFLPGTLDTVADERAAIRRLEVVRPPLVVVGSRDLDIYGYPTFGRDYNRVLAGYLATAYEQVAEFGAFDDPPPGAQPSQAFRVLALPERAAAARAVAQRLR